MTGDNSLPSHGMTASGLEGRYALALFELAKSEKALEAVAKDCVLLRGLASDNRDFAAFLRNPVLDARAKRETVSALSAQLALHPLSGKFLGVLANNRRLPVLVTILETFAALMATERGETRVLVTSAQPLTDTQQQEIAARLEKSLGQKPTLAMRVDKRLLGGLKIQVGSKVIDSSLKTQLDALTLQMKGA